MYYCIGKTKDEKFTTQAEDTINSIVLILKIILIFTKNKNLNDYTKNLTTLYMKITYIL